MTAVTESTAGFILQPYDGMVPMFLSFTTIDPSPHTTPSRALIGHHEGTALSQTADNRMGPDGLSTAPVPMLNPHKKA